MTNSARCPKCDDDITNIHYELYNPNSSSGYRGSKSFTAVAFPCKHTLGAVPVTWELRLEEIEKLSKELNEKLDYLHNQISNLTMSIRKK